MIASRLLPFALMILCTAGPLAAQELARSLNPLAALDQASIKAFVEQPLFEPSRRPPVVAPPYVYVTSSVPTVVEKPPSLRLLGLVESTRSIFAIVYSNDTGKTETLRPGDRIGSWVTQITAANLRVISGNRAFDYTLFRGGPSQGPVAVQMLPTGFVTPAVAARDHAPPAR